MGIIGIGLGNVTIQVKAGVVRLSGLVDSEILKKDCLGAVARIEGVISVDGSQFYVRLPYYGP